MTHSDKLSLAIYKYARSAEVSGTPPKPKEDVIGGISRDVQPNVDLTNEEVPTEHNTPTDVGYENEQTIAGTGSGPVIGSPSNKQVS